MIIITMILGGCEVYPVDEDLYSDDSNPLVGTWTCTEFSEHDSYFTYPVNIVKDPVSEERIILENFGFIGFDEKPPYAIVNGSTLVVPQQDVCDDGSMTVSGSGQIESNKTMKFEYLIIIGGDRFNYTALFEKNN